jgi:hypothetical protein
MEVVHVVLIRVGALVAAHGGPAGEGEGEQSRSNRQV